MPPTLPIADLHCDLLAFLANDPRRSPHDPKARASLPQLEAGGVRTQVLAIFVLTDRDSVAAGARQAEAYRRLLRDEGERVRRIAAASDIAADERIGVLPAFENASSLAAENDPIQDGLDRFDRLLESIGPVLYVSLTWADDNRFGGGNRSQRGLRDDGRRLLDHLAARRAAGAGGPAVDFSHASPWLADDMLEHLERTGARVPVLASHSCFRHLTDTPRNLHDDHARAIFARGGVVGLNLMQPWNGGVAPQRFVEQARHAAALGGGDSFGLGADFYCTEDVPLAVRSQLTVDEFFPEFGDASCYPRLVDGFRDHGFEDIDTIGRFGHGAVEGFVGRVLAASE